MIEASLFSLRNRNLRLPTDVQLSKWGFRKVSKVSKFWKYIQMDMTDFGTHPDLRGELTRLHSAAQHFVRVLNATPNEICLNSG